MVNNNLIKDLTNCLTFLFYSILSMVIYFHIQYKNMMVISLFFTIVSLVFIFFNIFTYDNQSYKVSKLKNLFFSISLVGLAVFVELIKEMANDEIIDNKKRILILIIFLILSNFIALIIKAMPLIGTILYGLICVLTSFGGSLAGLHGFINIAKLLPVSYIEFIEDSLYNIAIISLLVLSALVFIKKVME